ASLGGDIEAPLLDGGRTRVKVPTGVQTGKRLRLRGKGMPALQRPGQWGELYIELSVETPVNLTARQKELLQEFEQEGKNNSPESNDFFGQVKDFWNRMKR
ncbi:MAG: DnaJ C-terminal domain-containing protein, partial [Pseudomonadota bacterium]